MKAMRVLGWTIGTALGLVFTIVALFILSAWIGSSIPRNADWEEAETGIPIMVETNGTHTGIVMPVVTPVKDWRETFPSAGEQIPNGTAMPTHVSVGWGEREVFLDTPTWADLKPTTALRIAFAGGPAVIRVGHYANPGSGPNHRWITLRPEEYAQLVERVENALPPIDNPEDRYSHDSFDAHARVYDSAGRYTLANTCNQWVGDTLAIAGVKVGLWTPLAGGVMKWIPAKPKAD